MNKKQNYTAPEMLKVEIAIKNRILDGSIGATMEGLNSKNGNWEDDTPEVG